MTRSPVRRSFVAALAALMLAVFSAPASAPSKAMAKPKPRPAAVSVDATAAVAESLNLFTLDLYRSVAAQPGNLILSPASVYLGLALVMAGARGQTLTEFRPALHVSLPEDQFHPGLGALVQGLSSRGEDYQLKWSSRFWARDGYKISPPYADLVSKVYGSAPGAFSSSAVADEINQWVAEQTGGEISNILAPGEISPATDLVLVNALAFEGWWQKPFSESATGLAPFHPAPGDSVSATMMRLKTNCRYGRGPGFSQLTLAYRGDGLVMTIILPDRQNGLAALEKSLDWVKVGGALAALPEEYVEIRLPKFKFESRLELAEPLKSALPLALSPQADLSGITATGARPLTLNRVIHAARVSVYEKGTKAIAATVVTGVRNGHPAPKLQFVANHPFLFLIHDLKTGVILFIGRVMDPR